MTRYAMFSDARVESGHDGSPRSRSRELQHESWRRGLVGVDDLELHVRVAPGATEAGEPLGGQVHALPYYVGVRQFAAALPRLTAQIWSAVARADVVVTRVPGLIGTVSSLSALAQRRPLATELVGDPQEAVRASGGRLAPVLAGAGRALTALVVARADAVHYVTAEHLQRLYPSGSGALSVGFSDVDLTGWSTRPQGPEAAEPTAVVVGTHEQPYKGHDTFLRALALLREQGLVVRGVIVGKGRLQPGLRSLATELGLDDQVVFAGHLSDREALIDLIDSAWVYCMPSHTEGLPRALVEAMARSRACVGSDVGGIRELLPTQCQCPPGDVHAWAEAIRARVADPAMRQAEGRRNRAVALERYAPEVTRRLAGAWVDAVRSLG